MLARRSPIQGTLLAGVHQLPTTACASGSACFETFSESVLLDRTSREGTSLVNALHVLAMLSRATHGAAREPPSSLLPGRH